MREFGFLRSGTTNPGSPDRRGLSVRTKPPDRASSEPSRTPDPALLLRTFEQSGRGWFWATNSDGELTYLSAEIAPALSLENGTSATAVFADLFLQSHEETETVRTLSFAMIRRNSFANITVPNALGEERRWWSISGTPQYDEAGDFAGYFGSGADITSQRASSASASRMAKYDALTDLPNRVRMSEVLETHLARYGHHKQPCAILLIDLDRFKQVNDTMGHPAGDALLKIVSERLFRIVGDKERVFRLGGDEFQVFVPNTHDRAMLGEMGDQIISSLSEPYLIDGKRCVIGASVGIALSPDDGKTADELIRNADLALYRSKAEGRGCTSFFTSALLAEAEDRKAIEDDLRDALSREQFEVHYQPIVRARDNRTVGVEALLRWNHPKRGPVSPDTFIPIAEEANLILALGEWVLRKACEDAARWHGKIRVAVNVSPIQFASGNLPTLVMSALAHSGLEPHRLELEITEGVFLGEEEHTDVIFDALKRIGVRLALDDFGTGYSSLGYLRTAPFDKIKIDKSFVHAATLPGSRNAAIIAAIVALADALEMETTAEGIESQDQLAMIRDLGVSHVQGFIYSNPVPNAEVEKRLQAGNWGIVPNGPSKQRSDRTSIYRKVTAIFGNHCRTVLIRNLSESGALVEGLDNVPIGSKLIIDFGEGQLTFASLVRRQARQYAVQFESLLARDENGRLRPQNRVSRMALRSAGLPGYVSDAPGVQDGGGGEARSDGATEGSVEAAKGIQTGGAARTGTSSDRVSQGCAGSRKQRGSGGNDDGFTGISGVGPGGENNAGNSATEGPDYCGEDFEGGKFGRALSPSDDNSGTLERFRTKLGIAPPMEKEHVLGRSPKDVGAGSGPSGDTLDHLAAVHLAKFGNDRARSEAEENLLLNHILPYFGHLRAGEITPEHVADWFKFISDSEALNPAEIKIAQDLLIQFEVKNIDELLGMTLSRKAVHERHLSEDEIYRLKRAVLESPNQQLRFLVSLLMLTGVRQRDLVEARWSDFDLDSGVWNMPNADREDIREVELCKEALELIRQVPRIEDSEYLLANPKTGKPYKSFASSWQTTLEKANITGLEIDDVRNCVEPRNRAAFMAKASVGSP